MSLKTLLLVLSIFFVPITAAVAQKSSGKILRKMPTPDGTLYFMNPGKFDLAQHKGCLIPDFTWLYKSANPVNDSVTMNFFLITHFEKLNNSNLLIKVDGKELYSTNAISLMYLEKKNKNWKRRLSIKMTISAFFEMLRHADDLEIQLHTDSKALLFKPTKKWEKMAGVASTILEAETGTHH